MTDNTMQAFEVFVQWQRGESHKHTITVTASDTKMALSLAKRNVDVRNEPVSIWVMPQNAIGRTTADDATLTPTIDREYRNVSWYAETGGSP